MSGSGYPGALWVQQPRLALCGHYRWRNAVVIAGYYRDQFRKYIRNRTGGPDLDADDPRAERGSKVASSAVYLSANMHKAPVLIIPCVEGRVENAGSVMAQASLYGFI